MKKLTRQLFTTNFGRNLKRTLGRDVYPSQISIKVLLLGLILCNFAYQLYACSVTVENTVTSSRQIELNIDCGEASNFILSESPTFKMNREEGITVKIDSIAPDKTHADISIRYPGGASGGNGIPYSVPPNFKEYNVLAVLFAFEDSDGQIAGMPNYATPTWLNRYVFGGDDVSYDGRPVDNSIKQHIEQSSYGRIRMAGEVYPEVVRIPLEKFRNVLDPSAPVASYDAEIIKAIQDQDPTYLDNKNFDFMIALSPDQYAVRRGLWTFTSNTLKNMQTSIKGALTHQIPLDPISELHTTIHNESRTSTNPNTVVTRYNVNSVDGVWLASDINHTGTNYFQGGRVINHNNTNSFYYIQLGTPLPSPETEVIVTYVPKSAYKIDSSVPDILVGDGWNTHTLHEFYHEFSKELDFGFSTRSGMGDLYKRPARVKSYDLMANGNNSGTLPSGKSYRESSYLSAHNRLAFGFLSPYTLNYGENETAIRLHKAEIDDYVSLNEDIRLIKIPLHPLGDFGAQIMPNLYNKFEEFLGEEYLLLEWRYKGPLNNGVYNFDALLPTEGLVIYHVIESNPFEITGHSKDIVRIIDATPPISEITLKEQVEDFSDTPESPALFGHESGVMTYIAGDFWQEKTSDPMNASFLLSPFSGEKTIFARFKDADGVVIANEELVVELIDDQEPIGRLPTIEFSNLTDGAYISTFHTAKPEIYAPNGLKLIRYYVDGELQKYDRNITLSSNISFFIRGSDYSNGAHILTAEIYDNGLNKAEVSTAFQVGDTSMNQPPIADAGADLEVFDHDNDGVEAVTLDGSASSDPDGILNPANCEWRQDGNVIATGELPTVNLTVGVHTIVLSVTDDQGATHSDSVNVTVEPAPNEPPIADAGPDQTITDTDNDGFESVTLDGSASSDPDGMMASYEWREDKTLIATGESPLIDFSVGVHTVSLTVIDSDGAKNDDEVIITVEAMPNTAPTADAGPDQTVTDKDDDGFESVTLDGSASSDPDGILNPANCEWRQDGNVIATGELPTVNLTVGVHTIVLSVTDDQGATHSDSVNVTVEPAPNMLPLADAGADQTYTDSDNDGVEAIVLDGSASSDPDGMIVSYEWFNEGVLIATGESATVNLAVGVYTITLTVTDSDGATQYDDVQITVLKSEMIEAPENLTGSVVDTTVLLTWTDNSYNEEGFIIERGAKVKGKLRYSQAGQVAADITQFSETVKDGSYFYRVQGVNQTRGLVSTYSNEVVLDVSDKGGRKGGPKLSMSQ